MFETPFIRRQMSEVVQRYLLPWAWQRVADEENGAANGAAATLEATALAAQSRRILLLQAPLQLPPEIPVVERVVDARQMRPGKPAPGRGSFASQSLWPELGLHCLPFAWLGFLFQGEIDLRIGASRNLRVGENGEGKIYIVSLQAPTLFVIPPGVPHPDGQQIPWERPLHLLREEPQIFWIHVSPGGLRCHLSRVAQGRYQEEFFVLLNSEPLMTLTRLFLAEVQRTRRFPLVVEATILSLLLEIKRNLLESETAEKAADPAPIPAVNYSPSAVSAITIETARRFIEMHLNWHTLSPEMVAQHCHVSASHLNRIFKAEMGLTVKAYIGRNRLNVAKSLLEESDLAVSEVGFLSGFSRLRTSRAPSLRPKALPRKSFAPRKDAAKAPRQTRENQPSQICMEKCAKIGIALTKECRFEIEKTGLRVYLL